MLLNLLRQKQTLIHGLHMNLHSKDLAHIGNILSDKDVQATTTLKGRRSCINIEIKAESVECSDFLSTETVSVVQFLKVGG